MPDIVLSRASRSVISVEEARDTPAGANPAVQLRPGEEEFTRYTSKTGEGCNFKVIRRGGARADRVEGSSNEPLLEAVRQMVGDLSLLRSVNRIPAIRLST